ncbi:MAG: O-antigen ligase family protein [Bacteroidetes bacterium]|nr:O-antigen ligase family protein [Bacteroidota bacterium]
MIFLLPLSTELEVTTTLSLDFPDEPLLILLTGFFIIKIIYKPFFFPKSIIQQPLFLLLLLHVLWIAFACIYSTNLIISLKYLAAKIWYIIPFTILPFIILSTEKKIKQFALLLLFPMIAVAVQSIVRHSFYDFSFEGIKKTLSPFFRNHVNYSGMLVCMFPIAWAMFKLTPKNNIYRKFLLVILFVLFASLLLSYSRGAWAALVVGVLAGCVIYYKKIKIAIALILFFFCISFTWLFWNNNYLKFAPEYNTTIFHTDFSKHLEATITLKDVSNAERFYRWVAAFNMIKAKPVIGFGPNCFYDNYKNYTESIFKTWVSNNKDHSSVHNYFLLIGLEQGLIGLLLFVILFFATLIELQNLYHSIEAVFYKQIALATSIVLVMIGVLIFLSDLIETDKIGSLFWLCLGITFILIEKYKLEQYQQNDIVK